MCSAGFNNFKIISFFTLLLHHVTRDLTNTPIQHIDFFFNLGSQSVNLFRRYMYGRLNRFQKYINLIILCSFLCWNWHREHKAYMSSLLLKRSQSIYRKKVRLIHSKRSTYILKNDLVFVLWLRGTMQPPNNLLLTCMYTYDINI